MPFLLAAAAVIFAATVIVAAAVVVITVPATTEQDQQDDDPAPVTAKAIIAHKITSTGRFERQVAAHSMVFRGGKNVRRFPC